MPARARWITCSFDRPRLVALLPAKECRTTTAGEGGEPRSWTSCFSMPVTKAGVNGGEEGGSCLVETRSPAWISTRQAGCLPYESPRLPRQAHVGQP